MLYAKLKFIRFTEAKETYQSVFTKELGARSWPQIGPAPAEISLWWVGPTAPPVAASRNFAGPWRDLGVTGRSLGIRIGIIF